jgi:hypothetical protein
VSAPVTAEETQLLRDALDVMRARDLPEDPIRVIAHNARINSLDSALRDHEDGECMEGAGGECLIVGAARRILAGEDL